MKYATELEDAMKHYAELNAQVAEDAANAAAKRTQTPRTGTIIFCGSAF